MTPAVLPLRGLIYAYEFFDVAPKVKRPPSESVFAYIIPLQGDNP